MTNYRTRFGYYNYSNASNQYSSETIGFEGTNLLTPHRSLCWVTAGNFEITTANQKIYINDGSDKTVDVPTGSYSGGSALASAITSALNTSSSQWTVSYNSSTDEFEVIRSVSGTLRFSQQTNAIWDTIGFVGVIDSTNTAFYADEPRLHTSEWVVVDAGAVLPVKMFCIVSEIDLPFSISTTATVYLHGNNSDSWAAPAFSMAGDVTERGIFWNISEDTFSSYRFWKFEFVDRTNLNGPNFALGHMFIGDILNFETTNVAKGFTRTIIDPSIAQISESGTVYYDIRTPYESFNSLTVQNATSEERQMVKDMFDVNGVHTPFFVSLDPFLQFSDETDEYTRYVQFETPPMATHKFIDYYDITMSLREAI